LTGIHYFTKGSDFVKYAKQMIAKDIRWNNEFYLSLVYNEMIQDGKKIKIEHCKKMYNVGDPESLNEYFKSHNK
jgi:hypothetical protein